MMDPEYYVGAFRQPEGLWQTRKFSDNADSAEGQDIETVIWTRKPLYCCKIPGEALWCSDMTTTQQAESNFLGGPETAQSGLPLESLHN